jgi:hypothetical protein
MADLPYPLSSDDLSEFRSQMFDTFKDLYENRIGGASVGDVFTNASDVLELQIAEDCGLFKNDDDELDFAVTASTISNTPAGNIEATTVQMAINELMADKVQTTKPTFNAFGVSEIVQPLGWVDASFPPVVGYIMIGCYESGGNCIYFWKKTEANAGILALDRLP